MTPCETCGSDEPIGVCCIPGLPYSAAYCLECLEAGAHPWWALLFMAVEGAGGYENLHEGIKEMIDCTCKRLNRPLELFIIEVNIDMVKEPT